MTQASHSPLSPQDRSLMLRQKIAGYSSLVMLLLVSIPFVIPLLIFYGLDAERVTEAIGPALLATVGAEIVTIGIILAISGALKDWRRFLGLQNFKIKTFFIGLSVGVLSLIALQIISGIAGRAGANLDSSDTSNMLGDTTGIEQYLILFLAVPFIIPFVEELFFRGATLSAILFGHNADPKNLRATGTMLAIGFSSLFFALAHFQGFSNITGVVVVLWTFIFAIINAVLRLRYDSIYPAYASHMSYNLITAAFIFVA